MSQLALAFDAPTAGLPFDPWSYLGNDADPVRFVLGAMDAAEDAIAEASEAHPERAGLLAQAFMVLRPRSEIFGPVAPHVLRSHMDELLGRIVSTGERADVASGTSAEVVRAVLHIGLAAPLHHDYQVVAHVAFLDAFGEDEAVRTLGAEAVRRAHIDRDQERVADAYADLRRHMRDEERGKAWEGRCP